ncbi:MAG: TetM/TetW/TetO/TetS family tetracycline resistance ribosomal protection protein [Lachnospiraceae bacterium]|nr:TetM/TetW/TetO/TetS family tetracycline resistance ribosomal protection protein [Lachnospiraceae bacterium]
MKRFVIGILAHVDAGKTTLSDTILYLCKSIRRPGRVDKKDSFLDSYALERERGITIFSKQAVFEYGDVSFTLLDTPGHVDFSPEMERTLAVLDAAVLVISGPEGIQAHTRTLWKLLSIYDIPVFIFANKMDRNVRGASDVMAELKAGLSSSCVDMTEFLNEDAKASLKNSVYEEISLCDEEVLENFVETGDVSDEEIGGLITSRKLFPVIFGSALKQEGVIQLLNAMKSFLPEIEYGEIPSARVIKTGRDPSGKLVTYIKVTGGEFKTRDQINYSKNGEEYSEKITEIRIYNGEKFENTDTAISGMVVGITGISFLQSGDVLGDEDPLPEKKLTPVLSYRIAEPPERLRTLRPVFKKLEEEEPSLNVHWNDETKELQISIMGEIQLEVLKSKLKDRYNEEVSFDKGSIIYKETITGPVLGVGHYEPLRHYAEVQLVIEPGEPGKGIVFESGVLREDLELNWQRLIMTHIFEKEHLGCLIGAPIDDIRITLVAGRAHQKHTEGGDFRQATYRALRQGLMKAAVQGYGRILEPYYDFTLELPKECTGRAMTDIDRKSGKITGHQEIEGTGMVVLTGTAPVSELSGYSMDVTAYTKGLGNIYCTYAGYRQCHNEKEIIEKKAYDAVSDMRNPSYSVFCAHGAGFAVEWNEVDSYKHIDLKVSFNGTGGKSGFSIEKENEDFAEKKEPTSADPGASISGDEIDSIINRTYFANKKQEYRNPFRRKKTVLTAVPTKQKTEMPKKTAYLLVDGYNIIFAWDELKTLADDNLDSARDRLNEILINYKGMHDTEIIVVYDAYRVQGHPTEYLRLENINVVFTKEAETADRFIERFAHENASRFDVTVATSDGLEQIIIRGQGARLLSARDFKEEVDRTRDNIREKLQKGNDNFTLKSAMSTKIDDLF